MISNEAIQALMDLGFTRLESEVYLLLVRRPPATGYQVAKVLGKSNAATYKVLEALEAKGAVWVDDGENRLCRAVPLDELLAQLERGFKRRKERAEAVVSSGETSPEDARVYQLATPDQVYERAARILRECRHMALMELFPGPLSAMRGVVEETARRGIRVSARVYEPAEIEGVNVVLSPPEFRTLEQSPYQLLTLFGDARQHLIALLTPDGLSVIQAAWSASPFLGWSYHTFVCTDFLFSSLFPKLMSVSTAEELRSEYLLWKEFYGYAEFDHPGFQALLAWLEQKFVVTSRQ